MVHAIFVVLHMAVKHGRVRLQSDLMRQLGSFEPLAAVDLVIADDVANAIGEDFSPPAGERIDSRFLQLHKGLCNRKLGALGEVSNLDHGESLQVNLREALFQARYQIQEILERQIRVKSSDYVELGNGLGVTRSGSLESFFERHGVSAGRVFLASESTQTAGSYAHIGRVDVAVYVKVSLIAMEALTHWPWPGNVRELRNVVERLPEDAEAESVLRFACAVLARQERKLRKLGTGLVLLFLTLFNAVLGLRQEGKACDVVERCFRFLPLDTRVFDPEVGVVTLLPIRHSLGIVDSVCQVLPNPHPWACELA